MAHTDPSLTPSLYGVMAEFQGPEELLEAARHAHEAGFTQLDAYSPVPIHGMGEYVGLPTTRVSLVCLIGGLCGGTFGYSLQYYINLIAYPINVGGRPLHSIPAFIPATYECTILFAALFAAIGMLIMNGFPLPYHPVFNVEAFRKSASSDGFFLCIEATDPKFDREKTTSYLKDLNPKGVYEVEP